MPKREKTPSPSRDEPKYFTVVHPWPGHLDLSLPGDGKLMCQWLAAACGTTDPILSYFYRPDSPGLCIIEVVKDWAEEHARRLLGCHSWQYFLCDKSKSDTANNATSVFYSHYTSHREVQKMGWKIVDLNDTWFGSHWDRATTFVRPYPRPTWCPPPAHDTTGHSFCRVLPVNLFPEGNSVNAPAVPVGSEKWIEKRATVPAFAMLKESRPTSERIITPIYDEDFGPTDSIMEFNKSTEVTGDLWGDTEPDEETELISDLPIASAVDPSDALEGVCPYHGRTCKKGLCDWRAKYEKMKEREQGYPKGPSNTKNYNQRPRNNRGRGSFPNQGSRSGTPTLSKPAATSPTTTQPPRGGGFGRGANAWGRGPPTFTPNAPSGSTPGQGNGTGRGGGQPAWAPARGRKPT